MDCGQQFIRILPSSLSSPLATPVMAVPEAVQALVPLPSIGYHCGPWLDVVMNKRMKRLSRRIYQRHHSTAPKAFGLPDLNCNPRQNFPTMSPATVYTRLFSADKGLIHLHR